MELVIVIIAFGIIGVISVAILRSAGDVYWGITNRKAVVITNQTALSRMVREISLQLDRSRLEYASDDQLQLVTPRLHTLTYSIGGAQISLSKNENPSRVLADHIVLANTSFGYRDSFGNILNAFPLSSADRQKVWTIDLEVETGLDTDTLALKSTIFPENLRYGQRMPYHD
ncbi:MAG: hypothetical protein V3U24_03950 [Candidatus Neomarinimicrobiota bacterium]